MNFKLHCFRFLFVILIAGFAAEHAKGVQGPPIGRPAFSFDAVGSWFGRAVPVDPFCPPGAPGCPVPPEIVMLPTFFADGNFIGIDSNVFLEGSHTTAHGQWRATGPFSVAAGFVFLQSGPNDVFAGAFRLTLQATVITADFLEGHIVGYFFPFTDSAGQTIIDPETGFPDPDPLAPLPDECLPGINNCLGVFEFTLRRISAPK
jgi:hypothetical protein